jgi:general secretion pathway protein G
MLIQQLNRRQSALRRRNAFTLLEVLVVVAILVVLASIASVSVFGELENAKRKKAEIQAKVLHDAVKNYYIKYDQYPPNLQALVNPAPGERPLLEGGMEALKTPWGGDYQIQAVQRGDSNETVILVQWQDADGNTRHFPKQ